MMQRKLFLSYVLIILFLVIVTFWAILFTVRNMVSDNIKATSEETMARWTSELSSVMSFGKTYLLNMAINEDVQSMMRAASSTSSDDYDRLTEFLSQTSQLLYANSVVLGNIPFMVEICYRDAGGAFVPVYYSSRQNVTDIPFYAADSPWVQELLGRDGQFLWSAPYDESYSYIRLSKVVYDSLDYSRIAGSISVEFPYQSIATGVLNRMRRDAGIEAFIIDKQDHTLVGYNYNDAYAKMQLEFHGTSNYMSGDGSSYIMERSLGDSNYYMVGIKPMEEVQQIWVSACMILFVAAALAAGAAIIMASMLSRSISKPVRELSETMKSVENGDLDIAVTSKYEGEMGELYSSFNYMISMINSLIEDNYVSQIHQKQSELNALQAQINTHFLYNTLDSINWLAKGYQADDISKLVTSLSTLLRISLNNGMLELTVAQELQHVRCYINIQNIRFDDLFAVEWDVDDTVLDDVIVKMLLQPLVENAINHGFKNPERDKSENCLHIRAGADREYLILQVKNNGSKTDYQKVCALVESGPGVEHKSYGVLSIKSRLEMYYNGKAGYRYSMEGDGMIVATIHIPRALTCTAKLSASESRRLGNV